MLKLVLDPITTAIPLPEGKLRMSGLVMSVASPLAAAWLWALGRREMALSVAASGLGGVAVDVLMSMVETAGAAG
jgi:hypothetical protein